MLYAVLALSVGAADPASSLLWTAGGHGTPVQWARHGQLDSTGWANHHSGPGRGDDVYQCASVASPAGDVQMLQAANAPTTVGVWGSDVASPASARLRSADTTWSVGGAAARLVEEWTAPVARPPPRYLRFFV